MPRIKLPCRIYFCLIGWAIIACQWQLSSVLAQPEQLNPIFSNKDTTFWQPLILTNLSGRMIDVEMPPNDTLTIYAGAASGGVWRSRDIGNTWQPIFDEQPCLAIGDIAIAPSAPNILYVGTGEANGGGGSLTYDGCGIFRSDNGGDTWQHIGLPNTGSIGRVAINPQNPQTVYVAAMGTLFDNNQERGVFKTTNGGQTWTQTLYLNDSTGCIDLAIHPLHPDTVFAAMWQRTRRPNARNYGGNASGLYRSIDGGKQWQLLKNGLPQQPMGRIGIAIAPNKPNCIYAVFIDQYGDLSGIFRSNDAGNTWRATRNNSSISNTNGYGWWFAKPVTAPDNADRLYIPLLDIWQGDNGGNRWTNISEQCIHYDQHSLFIHPLNPQLFVAANDGGIYISRSRGKTWRKTTNLPTTQFYCIAQDPLHPEILYGGMQDNGMITINNSTTLQHHTPPPNPPKETLNRAPKTKNLLPTTSFIAEHGDGVSFAVSQQSPYRLFYAFQYGDIYTQAETALWQEANTGIYKNDRCAWKIPIVYSTAHQTFICATQSIYRWHEKQHRWKPWGNRADFSNGGDGYNFHYGTITAIALSPSDTLNAYCGTDDGNIWATNDSGRTFAPINQNLPPLWVNAIALHPSNPLFVYTALSAYRHGKKDTYIYRTNNGGQTWQSIAFNLPAGTVANYLLWTQKTTDSTAILLAATDKGVWALTDGEQQWKPLHNGMPTVPVTDLCYNPTTQNLFAATYGRGIYQAKW